MSKNARRQLKMAILATTIAVAIKVTAKHFGSLDFTAQAATVCLIAVLIGTFFGLWIQLPIRIVIRNRREKGLNGVLIGVLIPFPIISVLCMQTLWNTHGWVTGTLLAWLICLLGTIIFWATAIWVRNHCTLPKIIARNINRSPGRFLRRFGTGG